MASKQTGNLEQKSDGTLVAYFAFWRFAIFGLFFVTAFFICVNALFRLYQELPVGFWKHWDENSRMVLIIVIIAIVMLVTPYSLLKGGYKKVQLEIRSDQVRYVTKAIRGGTLLSDNYNTLPYRHISRVDLRHHFLGSGLIDVVTTDKTYTIILLLPVAEQEICYQTLDEAIKTWQSKH